MHARHAFSVLLVTCVGCGARTGLLVPPPESEAGVDASRDSTIEADAIAETEADSTIEAGVDAPDSETETDADVSIDADAEPPVVPGLALVVRTPPAGDVSLLLADESTGAIVRRGAGVAIPGGPGPAGYFLGVAPDTHHAVVFGGFTDFGLLHESAATMVGYEFRPGNPVLGTTWSNDSTRFCAETISEAYVVGAEETGGGLFVKLPSPRGVSVCKWSHDDARVAWRTSSEIFVTDAAGGGALDVSGFGPTESFLTLHAWSPTETRLAFSTYEAALARGHLFTVVPGASRVEVDDGDFVEWSPDGRSVVVRHGDASSWTYRAVPAAGPLGAGIDITAPMTGDSFLEAASIDGAWLAYARGPAFTSTPTALDVTPVAGGSTIEIALSHGMGRAAWSSKDTFAFVDPTIGAGLEVLDPVKGAPPLLVGPPLGTVDSIDWIAWSPDASRIAYVRFRGTLQVCVVAIADLVERCSATIDDVEALIWSADGASLAFGAGAGVDVMPVATMIPAPVDIGGGSLLEYWWVGP